MAASEQIIKYTNDVNAAFDEIGKNVDEVVTGLTGITGDVAFLKATIDKLQQNPGPISPEDQVLLDAAQARANGLVTKTKAVSDSAKALDDATAPDEVPVAPTA